MEMMAKQLKRMRWPLRLYEILQEKKMLARGEFYSDGVSDPETCTKARLSGHHLAAGLAATLFHGRNYSFGRAEHSRSALKTPEASSGRQITRSGT